MQEDLTMEKEPELQKVLFLDIDGVLNCHSSQTYYSAEHPQKYGIDENCWNRLERLLEWNMDVGVVIHSGWSKHADDDNYQWNIGPTDKPIYIHTVLPEVARRLNLQPGRYLGCVRYIPGASKAERIRDWVKTNIKDRENFIGVVVDDDMSEYAGLETFESKENIFVRFTNPEFGLTQSDLNAIDTLFLR